MVIVSRIVHVLYISCFFFLAFYLRSIRDAFAIKKELAVVGVSVGFALFGIGMLWIENYENSPQYPYWLYTACITAFMGSFSCFYPVYLSYTFSQGKTGRGRSGHSRTTATSKHSVYSDQSTVSSPSLPLSRTQASKTSNVSIGLTVVKQQRFQTPAQLSSPRSPSSPPALNAHDHRSIIISRVEEKQSERVQHLRHHSEKEQELVQLLNTPEGLAAFENFAKMEFRLAAFPSFFLFILFFFNLMTSVCLCLVWRTSCFGDPSRCFGLPSWQPRSVRPVHHPPHKAWPRVRTSHQ